MSTEPEEEARVTKCYMAALRLGIRDAMLGALTTAFNNYLDLGASVLLLWYGGGIAIDPDGAITVGALIKYQLYWNMINNSYQARLNSEHLAWCRLHWGTITQALNNMLNAFTRAAGAAERVLSLVDLEPDIGSSGGAHADGAVDTWSVGFEKVTFRYQMRENVVLDGMSFSVDAGSVCALVGASGGGKSTVIHLLLRFYDPRAGKITLGDVDLRELDLRSVHRHVGFVAQVNVTHPAAMHRLTRCGRHLTSDGAGRATQETQLFNATIDENVRYGAPPGTTDEEVAAACRAAQADGFIRGFEDGYLTRVGDRGQRLSGGQKQRLAIARCLLRRPKLLLLDEATSALDAENEAAVQAALDGLIWSGEHTVILVAHRLSTVIRAHVILVVDGGAVAERGTHAELLAAPSGIYAGLVARQLQHQAAVQGPPADAAPAKPGANK